MEEGDTGLVKIGLLMPLLFPWLSVVACFAAQGGAIPFFLCFANLSGNALSPLFVR